MVTIGHSGRNTTWWSDGAGCDATYDLLLATLKMPQLGKTCQGTGGREVSLFQLINATFLH